MPHHPIALRYILILSSHICLGLLRGLSPTGLLTKTPHAFYFSSVNATCPDYLILLDLITHQIPILKNKIC
jgi:hypothetical protein